MNNLGTNYQIILGVLQKISKNRLLTCQRRKPKLSDLELISLSITAEYMGIDSKHNLFQRLSQFLCKKIERSVYNRRRRKLFHHTNHIRMKLAKAFNEFENYFIVDSMPLEVCKLVRSLRSNICKDIRSMPFQIKAIVLLKKQNSMDINYLQFVLLMGFSIVLI